MRTITENVATLLLALVLAIIIWGTAVRANDPESRLPLDIPVQVLGRPADSEVSGVPGRVEIVVEAPQSVLDQLSAGSFTAEIDLSEVPAGESTRPINVRFDEEQAEIVFQFPEEATVVVERIETRDIPVRVEVRGEVARGSARGEPFADPETIQVTGVASRVEQIAEARVTVFLDNARQDVVVTRRPSFYDRQGNITSINTLTLSSDEVVVTVPVNQLAGFAAKPIIVNWEGEPAAGYRLLNVTVEPDSLLVTGPPEQLDNLTGLRTETIDITGLKEPITIPVTLDLPDAITPDEVQPVLVAIEIEPILTSDVVRTRPEIRALGEGLTATLGVEEVSVFLFGPLDKLESLLEEDVRATLDLFGLEIGSHSVEVNADVFVSDVIIRSVQPAQVTVNITRALTTTEDLTGTVPLTETTSLAPAGAMGAGTMAPWLSLAWLGVPAALFPAGLVAGRRRWR